jgi:hypothetical protein
VVHDLRHDVVVIHVARIDRRYVVNALKRSVTVAPLKIRPKLGNLERIAVFHIADYRTSGLAGPEILL